MRVDVQIALVRCAGHAESRKHHNQKRKLLVCLDC